MARLRRNPKPPRAYLPRGAPDCATYDASVRSCYIAFPSSNGIVFPSNEASLMRAFPSLPLQQDTIPDVDVHLLLMHISLVSPRKTMNSPFTTQSAALEWTIVEMRSSVVASEVRHA